MRFLTHFALRVVLDQPQVRLSLSDEASSALLENAEAPPEGEPERLYVVMPMRL